MRDAALRINPDLDHVLALTKAFALCAGRDEALAIRNDVGLFADVRAAILKIENPDSGRAGSKAGVELETAIGQLVDEAVVADTVRRVLTVRPSAAIKCEWTGWGRP